MRRGLHCPPPGRGRGAAQSAPEQEDEYVRLRREALMNRVAKRAQSAENQPPAENSEPQPPLERAYTMAENLGDAFGNLGRNPQTRTKILDYFEHDDQAEPAGDEEEELPVGYVLLPICCPSCEARFLQKFQFVPEPLVDDEGQ